MKITIKTIFCLNLLGISCFAMAQPIILENDFWKAKLDIDNGGRASSLIWKAKNLETVSLYENYYYHKKNHRHGGVFSGHMGGSYLDEQMDQKVTILKKSPSTIVMEWKNPFSLFSGLVERKTIELQGRNIVMHLNIRNEGKQERSICYRLQDFWGIQRRSEEDYCVFGDKKRTMFSLYPQKSMEKSVSNPENSAIALFYPSSDFAISLSTPCATTGLYTWFRGNSSANTMEFFMPLKKLKGGESITYSFCYTGMVPSQTDTVVKIWQNLSEKQHLTVQSDIVVPYRGVLKLKTDPEAVTILPLNAVDTRLGKVFPGNRNFTLTSLSLGGTPGERVDFALAFKGGNTKSLTSWKFSPLTKQQSDLTALFCSVRIPEDVFSVRYVTDEGYYLVNDQRLTKVSNNTLTLFGNNEKDSDKTSALSLMPNETAWSKVSIRIPENAEAGNYTSTLKIAGHDITINLEVYPFRLNKEKAKAYGPFFAVYTKSGNKKYEMSRSEFQDGLKFVADNGCNSIVIYTNNKPDLLWAIDELWKMGWRNSVICPIYRLLSAKEVKELSSKYGYTFLTWSIDEPSAYWMLELAVERSKKIIASGLKYPTFTPSTPMGMLLAELRPEYVPIFNTNGLMSILMKISRDYAKKNRLVFWYTCRTGILSKQHQLMERLIHGLYLWKNPVNGIFDWGETISQKTKESQGYCGFAGRKMLSSIRRENNFEGYKDYLYMKTLCDLLQNAKDSEAKHNAEKFVNSVAAMLSDDYYQAYKSFDQISLDELRRVTASHITKLQNQ